MKWSIQYATGIPHLDEQHKWLFKLAENYRRLLETEGSVRLYSQWLQVLETYARAHFGNEEGCMHRYQCPAAGANSEAHSEFLHALGSFKRRHAEVGCTDADAWQLVEFLEGWLASHIGTIDVQLRHCVDKPGL